MSHDSLNRLLESSHKLIAKEVENSFVARKVICGLETYIGNKLDWKHIFRLETIFLDWKQKKYIGNNLFRLETKKVHWKQSF